MTLLEKITTKYHNFLFQKAQKIEPKFYLVANNTEIDNYEFLKDTGFYDINSICVLFNNSYPISIDSDIQKHHNKWIFFRCLAKANNLDNAYYLGLDILNTYIFNRYYFIPDILDNIQYKNINYFWPTISYLKNNNIPLSKLHHMDIFESEEFRKIKKYHSLNNKSISSGLWVYLYIKNRYPTSRITLVSYSSNINQKYHNPSFEHGYLLSEILNKRCDYIKCFGLDPD